MTGTPPSTSVSARALLSEAVVSAASVDTPDPTHVRINSPSSSQPPRPPLSPLSRRKPSPLPAPMSIPAPPTTRQRQRQPSTDRLETVLNSCNNINFTGCHREYRDYIDHCPLSSGSRERTYSNSPPRGLSTLSQGISPRLEPSLLPHSIHNQPPSHPSHALQSHGRKPSGSRKRTFSSASNRSSTARLPANLESPIRDPYRSRKPSASAKGVKNEYQAQTQMQGQPRSPSSRASLQPQQRQQQQQLQQQFYDGSGGYGSGGEHRDGQPLAATEQSMGVIQQPYHQSPTLSASQALLARSQAAPGGPGASGGGLDVSYSPSFQGYHQPVQYQPAFQTSPPLSMQGVPVSHPGYRASLSGYPSSGPGELMGAPGYMSGGEEHMDYVVDPYRSAYSQQHSGALSTYHEDLNQPSYNPRYSVVSSGGTSGQHYPMQILHSRDSNQALLSAPFQPQASPAMHQLSQAGSRMSQPLQTEEDENDRPQRVSYSNGNVTGNRRSNSGSQTKVFATLDDSEEEGQEKGESRWREKKRCFCCSRRVCVYMSFLFAICLGIALFFVVPRAPTITYSSLRPLGPPVVTRDHIEEPFTLQVRVDNTDNYLPFKLNSMDMSVWMKIDFTKIGNNDDLPSNYVIKPRQVSVISIPMALNYTSLKIDTNADGTLQTLITACKPVAPNSPDPVVGLNLVFGGKMFVWGLSWVWKPQFSFNVDSAPCPVNARDPVEIEPPPPSQPSSSSGPVNGTMTPGTRTGTPTATLTGTHLLSMTTTTSAPGATTPP